MMDTLNHLLVGAEKYGWSMGGIDLEVKMDREEIEKRFFSFFYRSSEYRMIAQNEKGDKFVWVEDLGQHLANGGRYHLSRDGGEIHTDAPQYNKRPDLIILYMVKQAEVGGDSILVSASALEQYLLKNGFTRSELEMSVPFEVRPDGRTNWGSIFTYANSVMSECRYLCSYIRSGMKLEKVVNHRVEELITAINEYLECESHQQILRLNPGEALVLDNKLMLHGRKSFETTKQSARLAARLWLSEKR